MNQSEGMRINKFLSAAGVCSRREADRLIAAGKVTVAGETAELGTLVSAGMEVKVNGRRVGAVEELASKKKVLLAVNKPVGVVCTTTDNDRAPNIVELIDYPERVYPIGRLDKDSEGLLLLTNQGELVNQILRCENGHEKEYIVLVDEARVFIPASLVSDSYERDLNKYADQEIEFVITEFNPRRRRIIGDRKQLMQAAKAELQKELFARIKVGDVVEGTVKNVTNFGAFVDLGGADGLLHISEMSWGRIENPKKVLKSGDRVRVFIKEISGTKIALSLKFPDQNPWINAAEKYAQGKIVRGRVARMTDFGAFIELEPGVDALLHVSQIARKHIDKPSDVLEIGDEIEAEIVEFNAEDRKISLSMKALENMQGDEVVYEDAAPQDEQ